MSDKDDIRPRGIPFFSVVDELGVSTDGQSASMSLIRSRGMQPICEVNSSGVATSGSTLTALRARGIRFYCPVTENGVTADAVSMATLRTRGIPFFCPVGTDGIATGGTATMRELAARGIPYVCLLDSLGGAGGSPGPTPPTAPVLAMDPLWDETDDTPDFTIDIDGTVAAGDDIRIQIQADGGDWSSPVSDNTHEITAPEDAADEVDLAQGPLANGNYEARCNVTTTDGTSAWSNTVAFTIAASTTAGQPIGILLTLTKAA